MYTGYVDEGADGRATLEWIAAQWWCDGNVGTFGASALGMTQYAFSPGANPVLKCMVPIVGTPDFYHHAIYQGGALRYALDSRLARRPGRARHLRAAQGAPAVGRLVGGVRGAAEGGEVDVPALHVGGWFDIFLQGTLDAFTSFQHHGGPAGARERRR